MKKKAKLNFFISLMKVQDLKGKTIALLASGGLDSCTTTRWLSDHGVNVVCLTADLGQPDEKDINAIEKRMRACGAVDFALLDARAALSEAGLKVIQSQALYEGRYWNTTGIARYITTEAAIKEMRKRDLSILSHGATGRGNDQVRFQLACNMLEPSFSIYAPWRDEEFIKTFGGRIQMIEFCEARKLPITASKDSPYSTDANLLGLTHEGGRLESLETAAFFITPGMGVLPTAAPDQPENLTIRFKDGRPTAINGTSLGLLDLFLEANRLGGKHGIGIAEHVTENRFVGVKSRGVYEAPAMELLGSAYAYLLELVLDKRAKDAFEVVSRIVAKQIYQGYWYDLATQMALAAVDVTSKRISGEITLQLYKGRLSFVAAADVAHNIYSEAESSMEAIGSYNHNDSEGLLAILGVSARVLAKAGLVGNSEKI